MSTATGGWIGATLADGRYHVTRVLGEGGMGVAYLAWDARLETEVVLKVPHRHLLTSPEVVQRFAREIRSLVTLSHPHVVRVSDVAEHEGVPYSVLQYLSGGSLDDRLRQLPPSATLWQRCELLLSWIEAIAKALDFVHEHGCVHRDIKPANILFDKHGNAYLADFGVAKTIADQQNAKQATALTGQGMVLGTPDYMAPELITANQFDGRVDQYAMAFTVFEVLAGRLPLSAPSPTAMLVAHATQRPTHLAEVSPALPPEVAAAVARGMAKNPAERHPSCHAFAVAVTTVLRSAPRAALEAAQVTGQIVQESARLACPACNAVLRVLPNLRGQRVPCSKCRTPLWVAPDLQRLELAASVPGATAVQIPTPQVATVPTSAIPVPTLPLGTTAVRSAIVPPPLARHAVGTPLAATMAGDGAAAGGSVLTWLAIGSLTGIVAIALLYLGLRAEADAPSKADAPSSNQVAEVTTPPDKQLENPDLGGVGGSVESTSTPATTSQPASTNPPIAKPVQLNPATPTTLKIDEVKPDGVKDEPPIDASKPQSSSGGASVAEPASQPMTSPAPTTPAPPVESRDPQVTIPVPIKPQVRGPLANLPKQFALPEIVAGQKPVAVKLGAIALKADETLELKLLADVDGVKAKRATASAPAIAGLPTKKEYRYELSKGSQPSRWNVLAKVLPTLVEALTTPAGKHEPDVPVGEFFVADDHLQFQWAAQLDEAVANPLRSAVLVASVGAIERAIGLRDVVRQPPLAIDLEQKIARVQFNNVKGLPAREAIWLEVLDARGFPGPLTYDPAQKRSQGRNLDVVMYPSKPRVWIDINANVSSSGGAVLFKPLYVLFGTREDEFTNDHLDPFNDIEQLINNNLDLIRDSQQAISVLNGDLAGLPAPNDLAEVQALSIRRSRILANITNAKGRITTANSNIAKLRVMQPAWPTLEAMRQVHQRGYLSYRVFYIVGGHEVDVLRAETTQP